MKPALVLCDLPRPPQPERFAVIAPVVNHLVRRDVPLEQRDLSVLERIPPPKHELPDAVLSLPGDPAVREREHHVAHPLPPVHPALEPEPLPRPRRKPRVRFPLFSLSMYFVHD